jgi:FAD/FMN-containing dehydrogenase
MPMITAELAAIVGEDHVRLDRDTCTEYGRDWTRWYTPNPQAVVFPGTADQVQQLVGWARRKGVAIVPSGGRTGLSGGAVAAKGELVISLGRLNRCGAADRLSHTLQCGAGTTIAQVRDAAGAAGLIYPVEFAPMDTMQVGGNIATNAGGVRVVKYGSTRRWVAGVTAVLGTGELVTFGGPTVKNNAGYELLQLMIGSEGTLGIITDATLRLSAPPRVVTTAYASAPAMGPMLALYERAAVRTGGGGVLACEVWDTAAHQISLAHTGLRWPERARAWQMLLELECDKAEAAEVLKDGMPGSVGSVKILSEAEAKTWWGVRLGIGGAVAPFTPYKNDIAVPVAALEGFLTDSLPRLAASHADCRLVVWGHLGDGNLHINFLKPAGMSAEEFGNKCRVLDDELFERVAACGGSISAEHGIGLTKVGALHYSRSAAEIGLMRKIKTVFDPDGIMNPGKVLA